MINFEPDIRSNFLAWLTGRAAARRLLDRRRRRVPHGRDSRTSRREHVGGQCADAHRARRRRSGPRQPGPRRRAPCSTLAPPDAADARAAQLLGTRRGRSSACTSAAAASRSSGISIGSPRRARRWRAARRDDRADRIGRRSAAGRRGRRRNSTACAVIDVGRHVDLPTLAALLADLDLLVTGDTGPMHLARRVDTPLVALFGPSDPARYGPRRRAAAVLRVSICPAVRAARCGCRRSAAAATCRTAWTASSRRGGRGRARTARRRLPPTRQTSPA